MKTVISNVKPTAGFCLEIVDSDNRINLSAKVVKAVPSAEHENTFICILEDGSKVLALYWKRLCD